MPNYRKLGLPKLTGNTGTDIQNLRNAFYQQDEQLRYLFEHLDGGNFTDEFFSSINDGVARWKTDNRVEIDTAGLVSEVLSAADDAFTRFEQTVQGITLTVVDSEGKETSVNLSSGKFDISFLESQISDAEKVATNYISMTPDGGIEVGNKTGDDWTGYRTQMLADSFNIVDESGNELASYEANAIYLGKSENKDTVIDFNNGMVTLSYDADNNRAKMRANRMFIYSDTGYEISIGSSQKDANDDVIGGQVFCNNNGTYLRGYSGDTYSVDLYSEMYLRFDGRGLWESVGADNEGYIQRSYIEMWPHKLLIRGQVLGTMWYMGRDDALIASTKYGSSESYFPLMDAKSQRGDWSAGVLGDNFYFIYTKDSDYEAGNNVTEKFWFEPRIGMRMATSEAIDRYYVAYSSASGESYGCGFGIGSGGVNRGFYDYKRNQWTLYNDATDTILRTTGAFYFYADTDADTTPHGVVIGNADRKNPILHPVVDAYGYLGGIDYRWNTLYTYNVNTTYAVNVSSDRRLKKDISYDLSCVDGLFDLLHPAVYRMQGDEDGLLRFGFIAQDMAETLEHLGLNPDDYALLRKGEDGFYSIGYTETNALLWNEVQKLKARIAELEKGVA